MDIVTLDFGTVPADSAVALCKALVTEFDSNFILQFQRLNNGQVVVQLGFHGFSNNAPDTMEVDKFVEWFATIHKVLK